MLRSSSVARWSGSVGRRSRGESVADFSRPRCDDALGRSRVGRHRTIRRLHRQRSWQFRRHPAPVCGRRCRADPGRAAGSRRPSVSECRISPRPGRDRGPACAHLDERPDPGTDGAAGRPGRAVRLLLGARGRDRAPSRRLGPGRGRDRAARTRLVVSLPGTHARCLPVGRPHPQERRRVRARDRDPDRTAARRPGHGVPHVDGGK